MSDEEPDKVVEVLEDIRRWVKIIGVQEAMSVLGEVLTDENDEGREKALKITYHLTDGTHSNDDIAEHIGYSSEFVRRRQNEWADLGLLEREKRTEPYSHVLSLEEAGIDVPEIPDPEDEQENGEAEEEEGRDDGTTESDENNSQGAEKPDDIDDENEEEVASITDWED